LERIVQKGFGFEVSEVGFFGLTLVLLPLSFVHPSPLHQSHRHRETLTAAPPSATAFQLPHTRIYEAYEAPPLQVQANEIQITQLGIGYFDCRVLTPPPSKPPTIAVWGDFSGLRLLTFPPGTDLAAAQTGQQPVMKVKKIANDWVVGVVQCIVEHPNRVGLFMATSEGLIIFVPDPWEGGVVPYR